jgi:cytochrome c oxidase assembly factor CtaG
MIALPQGALVGMVIAGTRHPLYAHYAAASPAALADQSNAAAVMWVAGGLVIFTALLSTLAVWARREADPSSRPAASLRTARPSRCSGRLPRRSF